MSLRIVGGDLKGRRLPVPPAGVRPTGARMREALFSMWAPRLTGCTFLDLFAGSGIMAFEALSRGAERAFLVDADGRGVSRLQTLARELVGDRARVLRGRLPARLIGKPQAQADLVFADPPYRYTAHEALLAALTPWLAVDAEVAIEHSARSDLPPVVGPLARFDVRTWGESRVSRYSLAGTATSVE